MRVSGAAPVTSWLLVINYTQSYSNDFVDLNVVTQNRNIFDSPRFLTTEMERARKVVKVLQTEKV